MNLLRRMVAELLAPPRWVVEAELAIAVWMRRRQETIKALESILAQRRVR